MDRREPTGTDASLMPRLGPPWWWGALSAVVFAAGLLQVAAAAYLAGAIDDDVATEFQRTAVGDVLEIAPDGSEPSARVLLHVWVEVPTDRPFDAPVLAFLDADGVRGAPLGPQRADDDTGDPDRRLEAPRLPGYRVQVDGVSVQGIPAGRLSLTGGEHVLTGDDGLDGLPLAVAEEALFPSLDPDQLPRSFTAGILLALGGGLLGVYGAWRRRAASRRLGHAIAREQVDAT